MGKIVLYKGEVKPLEFGFFKAEITFSDQSKATGIINRKHFSKTEANKGLEQLKRWVSTKAFSAVVIEDLYDALSLGAKEHISEWISDHIPDYDAPSLVLIEREEKPTYLFKTTTAENWDELKNLINIK